MHMFVRWHDHGDYGDGDDDDDRLFSYEGGLFVHEVHRGTHLTRIKE